MIVVSDTSAITSLLQIGKCDLLRELYGEVLIPNAVRVELLRSHNSLPSILRCESVRDSQLVSRLLAEIDPGEAEAIVLAQEWKADVLLIDEIEGRRVATREGLPIIGLLGVLVQAKLAGKISAVRPLIDSLEQNADFRVSKETRNTVLKSAGEL